MKTIVSATSHSLNGQKSLKTVKLSSKVKETGTYPFHLALGYKKSHLTNEDLEEAFSYYHFYRC